MYYKHHLFTFPWQSQQLRVEKVIGYWFCYRSFKIYSKINRLIFVWKEVFILYSCAKNSPCPNTEEHCNTSTLMNDSNCLSLCSSPELNSISSEQWKKLSFKPDQSTLKHPSCTIQLLSHFYLLPHSSLCSSLLATFSPYSCFGKIATDSSELSFFLST